MVRYAVNSTNLEFVSKALVKIKKNTTVLYFSSKENNIFYEA